MVLGRAVVEQANLDGSLFRGAGSAVAKVPKCADKALGKKGAKLRNLPGTFMNLGQSLDLNAFTFLTLIHH